MRFLFTAPFRTAVNLRTDAALAHEAATGEILDATVEALKDEFAVHSDWSAGLGESLRYGSIQDDWVPLSARPLFRVDLDAEDDRRFIVETLAKALVAAEAPPVEVHSARIDLYDNTVALLILDLSCSGCTGATDRGALLGSIDRASTELCEAITDRCQATVVGRVARRLFQEARRRRAQTPDLPELMRTPDRFVVYFDMARIVEDFSTVRNTTLWVNRVLFLDRVEAEDETYLQAWTQSALEIDVDRANAEGLHAFNVGNSVFAGALGRSERRSFQSALNTAQYYYSLYDVIDANLRYMYPKLVTDLGRRRLDKLQKRIHRSLSAIEFIGVELGDVLRGMQGYTRTWIDRIFKTWKFQDVRDSVAAKSEMTHNRLKKLVAERALSTRRWVEGILALIGAIALIDSAINLLTFSKSKEIPDDGITGLVDFFKELPPDGLFYVVAVVAVIIAFLYARKTE